MLKRWRRRREERITSSVSESVCVCVCACRHSAALHGPAISAAKLDRLPEYLRDTVDWFMG